MRWYASRPEPRAGGGGRCSAFAVGTGSAFQQGYYVKASPSSRVDHLGRLLHTGHEPCHTEESTRKGGGTPHLEVDELLAIRDHAAVDGNLRSLRLKCLRSGKAMTAREMRDAINNQGEKLASAKIGDVTGAATEDDVYALLDSEDGDNEIGLLREAKGNPDMVFLCKFSVHMDATAADNAGDVDEAHLVTYSELHFPGKLTSDNEPRAYDVTKIVRDAERAPEGWSIFDEFIKKAEHAHIDKNTPDGFEERKVGKHDAHGDKSLRLQVMVCARLAQVKRSARCMEAQEVDGTRKVDKSGRSVEPVSLLPFNYC